MVDLEGGVISTTELRQRTIEWRQLRLGDVTASRFRDVLTPPRTKAARENGEWSVTACRYMVEKLTELITCQPSDTVQTEAMRWGTEWESAAFEEAVPLIEKLFGATLIAPVGEFAYIHHPTEDRIGCSPDGIIGDDGLLELKCPENPQNNMWTVWTGTMPENHLPQIQGSLWITGRKWYAFGSFDPRVANSGLEPLWITTVERDEEYIEQLAQRVTAFRDWLMEEYHTLVDRARPF